MKFKNRGRIVSGLFAAALFFFLAIQFQNCSGGGNSGGLNIPANTTSTTQFCQFYPNDPSCNTTNGTGSSPGVVASVAAGPCFGITTQNRDLVVFPGYYYSSGHTTVGGRAFNDLSQVVISNPTQATVSIQLQAAYFPTMEVIKDPVHNPNIGTLFQEIPSPFPTGTVTPNASLSDSCISLTLPPGTTYTVPDFVKYAISPQFSDPSALLAAVPTIGPVGDVLLSMVLGSAGPTTLKSMVQVTTVDSTGSVLGIPFSPTNYSALSAASGSIGPVANGDPNMAGAYTSWLSIQNFCSSSASYTIKVYSGSTLLRTSSAGLLGAGEIFDFSPRNASIFFGSGSGGHLGQSLEPNISFVVTSTCPAGDIVLFDTDTNTTDKSIKGIVQ